MGDMEVLEAKLLTPSQPLGHPWKFWGLTVQTSYVEDLEAKLKTPGQLLGHPWKLWGTTVQTSYVEGWWHQNWDRSRSAKSFCVWTCKFVKNGIFCSSACNSKRKSAIMMVHKRWNAGYTWGNKRLLGEKWLRGLFDCVLPAQSWEMAVDIYQITLIPWLGWIFNFEAVRFFRTPSMVFFFSLEIRVNFGRP